MRVIFEPFDISNCFDNLVVVDSVNTSKQNISLFLHPRLGKILCIDDEVQHVENWRFFYHEPLIHLPAALFDAPKSALILGGGSMFATREILRYATIEKVDQVDHDPYVFEIMKRNYKEIANTKNDDRLGFIESDVVDFARSSDEKYDIIINDSVDLSCCSKNNMYLMLEKMLHPDGICVDVLYRDIFCTDVISRSVKQLEACTNVKYSLLFVPEYPGVCHALCMWGKNSMLQKIPSKTKNGEQHNMNFSFFSPYNLSIHCHAPKILDYFLKLDS
jgi:spermidine synthase